MKYSFVKSGFTLVESIVSAMILSIAVIALSGICTKSISAVRTSREREQAWEVLDKQLQLVDYEGVDAIDEGNALSGVDEDYNIPYSWQLSIESLESGLLCEVTAKVSWQEGGLTRNIIATTRFNEDGDIGSESTVEGDEEDSSENTSTDSTDDTGN